MKVAVEIENVSKVYKTRVHGEGFTASLKGIVSPAYEYVQALDDISLRISPGECLGFVGPNGAGKSTLTKILTGLQSVSSGKVTVLGEDPNKRTKSVLSNIGVVFGHKTSLWWDLPLRDSFRDIKHLYNVDDSKFEQNFEILVKALSLGSLIGRPVRELSLGERVKGELAVQLAHEPKVLFLDEPTVGLDIESKAELRNVLRNWMQQKEMAVFLTSHDSADIDYCCDRITLVRNGKTRYAGSMDELRSELGVLKGNASELESKLITKFRGWRDGE